jgi:hypothetical protein
MSNKRVGGQVGDIFSKASPPPAKSETEPKPDQPKKAGRGRPKIHDEAYKTMVTLREEQALWLDRLALDVRANTRSIIDRGVIIRALIDSLMESGMDLSRATSESDVKEALLAEKGK